MAVQLIKIQIGINKTLKVKKNKDIPSIDNTTSPQFIMDESNNQYTESKI